MTAIAITGSTGHVGGRVARQVADLRPRLIVRDQSRAPLLDGIRVAVATYDDPAASAQALAGIDVLFMVSAAESSRRRAEHRAFIESAARAGVSHIVYTSFFRASPHAEFTLGRDHADAEDAIKASGMSYTLLRDNFYSDLLPFFAGSDGIIKGPSGDGAVSAVARADVADAASAVVRRPEQHAGKIYCLTGPEALSMDEVAARAGAVLGRRLAYRNETIEEAHASRALLSPAPWQMDAWVSTYTAIASGVLAEVRPDVERLTGQPARTIEQALSTTF